MTLEEQRAIEEEARNLGMTEAEDKVQELREEKAKEKVHPGVAAPVPGRDSGFGSEQDPHTREAGQGKDSCVNSLPTYISSKLIYFLRGKKIVNHGMGFLKYNKYFVEVLCNTQKLLYYFTKLTISQLSTYSCLCEFFCEVEGVFNLK